MTTIAINDLEGEYGLDIKALRNLVGGHGGVKRYMASARPWAAARRCNYFNRQRQPAHQADDLGIYLRYGKDNSNRSNNPRLERESLLDSVEGDDWMSVYRS